MVWLFVFLLGSFPLEQSIFLDNREKVDSLFTDVQVREPQILVDTLLLKEAEVFSQSLEKYRFGQHFKVIPTGDLSGFQGLGLSDFLQQRTALFFRQYGAGMLASMTMRGTSAGHNAVFWNGLPINSPSLGQTDFSILTIGGFDEISLHFGSGGALYGTDAIGGAVHLNSKLKFEQGHQFQLGTLAGSFGRWNQQIEYGFSSQKIATRTRVYKNVAGNDFPFLNLSKPGTPLERQENAAIKQIGVSQDLAFRISSDQLLSSSLWYNETEREIQPVMGSNTLDEQSDKNLRWALDYFRFWKEKTFNFKTGLVEDQLVFNGSNNNTLQLFLVGDLDWEFSPNLSSKSGVRYTHIKGNLSSYNANENRVELYQSTGLTIKEDLHVSFNLRQLVYDGNFAPFTPSLGAEWVLFSGKIQELKLKTTAARSFKVPTLNDRFWQPGGNPDLRPESSWSGEFGLSSAWRKGKLAINQDLGYYQMWVDNWIIWLPNGNFWSPENIRKVHNYGIEYFLDMEYNQGSWSFDLQGNYNWTRAINRTDISENDRSLGNQLPYTPIHKVQGNLGIGKGLFNTYFNYQFTGSRFVGTDNVDMLTPYHLWDWGFGMGEMKNRWLRANIGFQVNNIFNTSYQVLRLRAMPGRNYQINLQIKL